MIRMMRETWRRQGPTFADIEATAAGWPSGPTAPAGSGWSASAWVAASPCCWRPSTGFDAASVNYGPVSKKAYSEEVLTGACPVVGSYGAKDPATGVPANGSRGS